MLSAYGLPRDGEQDERALLEAAKEGDAEAFGTIVEAYMPRALAFARQMTGSREDAEDLVQEAFLRAYRGLRSFKGDSSFGTWFYRVLSNTCLDHLRKAAFLRKLLFVQAPLGDEDDDEQSPVEQARDERPDTRPDDRLLTKELGGRLTRALGGLPAKQRAVFLLKHNEGLKISEIAAVMRISEGTVKSHLVRAATALRKSMKGYAGHV